MIIGVFALKMLCVLGIVVPLVNSGQCSAGSKGSGDLEALYNELISFHDNLLQKYAELAATQQELRKSDERYKLIMEGANDGLWDYDVIKDELYLSERSAEILHLPAGVFGSLDKYCDLAVYPEDRAMIDKSRREQMEGKTGSLMLEHQVKTAPGTWILVRSQLLRDAAGTPVRIAGSHTDVTLMKAAEEELKRLAFCDSLTGLANRAALNERVAMMAQKCAGAFFFIDLDNFKTINDSFGHSCGDRILVLVGERLSQLGNGQGFVARPGGDEFAVLLENIKDGAEAEEYAEKMLRLFADPLSLDDKEYYVTLSVGITLCPADGTTAEKLFVNADLALYNAKAKGKNQYVCYSRELGEQARRKLLMERSLRNALANNEFQLYYQPVIRIADGQISGFEALLRWHSKDYGWVMPLDFIRLAEETGLIVPIGRWALKTACDFLASLRNKGYKKLQVSVNLSVVELYQGDFVAAVQEIIASAGIPPENMAIEITESMLMESLDANILKLLEVRRSGVSIYLDDFGTGYSSLKYLKDLPIDVLKIDKSFIDSMDGAGSDKGLIGAIIGLAHRLGLKTVAEGVETQEQLAKLENYQCTMCQGYLFSKPLPAEQIHMLLERDTVNGA